MTAYTYKAQIHMNKYKHTRIIHIQRGRYGPILVTWHVCICANIHEYIQADVNDTDAAQDDMAASVRRKEGILITLPRISEKVLYMCVCVYLYIFMYIVCMYIIFMVHLCDEKKAS